MSAFLLDLDKSFKDITQSVKTFNSGLSGLKSNYSGLDKIGDANSASAGKFAGALSKVGSAGKLVAGVATGLLAVGTAAQGLKTISDVSNAAYSTFKELNSVSQTLTFSEAITGSSQLATNLATLEKVSDNAFNRISIGLEAAFDTKKFNEWAGSAVSSYAQVEQSAYRLGTVTSGATERSIDSIDAGIKGTRELQKATNDALGTVELLNTQYDIASAGFTASKDTQQVGKASVNLSQAGFGDVQGSTNALVRTLRALGDGAEDAEKRAAQLFETTRVGLLDLNQLTPEVGALAVQSKNLEIRFEESQAALAGLTTQGLSASEANTRLNALFSEIVAGSTEANTYLASFRDEAGKPIQINASVLQEKGIAGIVDDIKKATGGSTAALQKIFSRQESIEGIQGLSSLGTDTLRDYTSKIDTASGGRLDEEAKNRGKTITGSFSKAANSSAKQVEDFGKGLAPSIIDGVGQSNEVINSLLTTSAEGVGNLAGSISALSTKIQGVGALFGAAFSAVAPLALFALVGKGVQTLAAKFKTLQKDGESPWATIQRLADGFIKSTEAKFIAFLRKVRDELAVVKAEIQAGIAETDGSKPKTTVEKDKAEDTKAVAKDSTSSSSSIDIDKDVSESRETKSKTETSTAKKDLSTSTDTKTATSSTDTRTTAVSNKDSKLSSRDVTSSTLDKQTKVFKDLTDKVVREDKLSTVSSKDTSVATKQVNKSGLDRLSTTSEDVKRSTTSDKKDSDLASSIKESLSSTENKTSSVSKKESTFSNKENTVTNKENNVSTDDRKSTASNKKDTVNNISTKETKLPTNASSIPEKPVRKVDSGRTSALDNVRQLFQPSASKERSAKSLYSSKPKLSFSDATEKITDKLTPPKLPSFKLPEIKVPAGLDKVAKVAGGAGNILSKGFSLAGPAISTAAKGLIGLGAAGIAAGAAISIVSGWSTTLGNFLNSKTNPALQTMRESIKDLKNVEGLDAIVKSLDPLTDNINSSSDSLTAFNSLMYESGKLWGMLTGASADYFGNTLPKLQEAQDLIDKSLNKNLKDASKGVFGAETEKGKEAEAKVNTGVELTADDLNALKEETEARKKKANAKVAIQEQKIKEGQGKYSQEELATEEALLAIYKGQAAEASKKFDGQLKGVKLSEAVKKLNNVDTSKPLQEQLSEQSNTAVTAQINSISAKFKDGVSGALKNPEAFEKLGTDVTNALGTIQTQIELDPDSAAKLTEDLRKSIPDFDKLIYSDPVLRAKSAEVNQQITKATVSKAQTIESTKTATFSGFEQLGGANKDSLAKNFEAKNESVKTQQNVLEAELKKPETSKTRQTEIKAQLAQLDAQKIQNALDESAAKIDLEYKAREKLAEQTLALAESFGNLASNSLISGSTAGASLERIQVQTKGESKSIETTAEKKVAEVQSKVSILEKLANQEGSVGEEARARLPKAKESAEKEIKSIKINAALAGVAQNLDLAAAKIKENNSVQSRLIEIADSLGGSFSSLASTASSLFQNSSLGASLEVFASQIRSSSGKASKEYKEQSEIVTARNKGLNEAVTKAKQSGADKGTVEKLQSVADKDNAALPAEQAQLKQKFILESLNERLSTMSAKVAETTDVLSKRASNSKDRLDLEQRKQNINSESNKANINLQGSLIGAFAKNNPFADSIQQRLDFQQAGDEATATKANNVTEAKKEIIDLSLQKASLVLEQQSYENALTQTQLLSDLVSVGQGGEAKFSSSSEVQDRLNKLPQLIQDSKATAGEKLGLVNEKLAFVPKELEAKNANVDKERLAKQITGLSSGGQFNTANIDLLQKTLGESTQSLSNFSRKEVSVGSLSDPSFQKDLNRLRVDPTTLKAAPDYAAATSSFRSSIAPVATGVSVPTKAASNQTMSIQAPVTLSITLGSDTAKSNPNLEQNIKAHVNNQINDAFSKLGKQLVTSARGG